MSGGYNEIAHSGEKKRGGREGEGKRRREGGGERKREREIILLFAIYGY